MITLSPSHRALAERCPSRYAMTMRYAGRCVRGGLSFSRIDDLVLPEARQLRRAAQTRAEEGDMRVKTGAKRECIVRK